MRATNPPPTPDSRTVVGAVPARYSSTRLPGKPLRLLAGKPMIEHVYRRAEQASALDRVIVLTDDERILEAVRGFGGLCEMTPEDCVSGTDRIAYAARGWDDADAVVNIQGDEPLIDPATIDAAARHLIEHPDDPIVTLAATAPDGAFEDPNTVKVVCDRRDYALYFSRSPIPYPRLPGAAPVLQHIGLYGYQREALLEMARFEPTPLERSESLEQLRALENGLRIRVLKVEGAEPGVDTEDDLARAEARLRSIRS